MFNGIFVLAGSLLGPLYAVFVESITGGIFPITLSWSVFLASSTMFSLVVSKYGDKVKEKEYLLMFGVLVRTVCWLSYAFITNFGQLLIIQFVLGLGEAVGTPTFDALFAEHLDKGKHLNEYSSWKVISNIALVVGTLLGGVVVQNYGFKPLFVTMAMLGVFSFAGVYFQSRRLL